MAIVAVAIVISFHIKNEPTKVERKTAYPVGLVFGALALACLGSGVAGYVRTVQRYGERRAMVQSGWKTQVVSTFLWGVCLGRGDREGKRVWGMGLMSAYRCLRLSRL